MACGRDSGLAKGILQAASKQTLREAAEAWLEGAKAGTITTRSGAPYKPSVLRAQEGDLRNYVLPELGALRLSEVRRVDVQAFADSLKAKGFSASKIRNAVMPLRAIYRRPLAHGEVQINPTSNLELPIVHGGRERTASPQEATELIEALPLLDRPLWQRRSTPGYAAANSADFAGMTSTSLKA